MEYSTDTVLEPLSAIVVDIAAWKPELKTACLTEIERLRKICNTRGCIRTVMSDLPGAGKHLDYCLSRGTLFHRGYPPTLGSPKAGTQIFSDLYSYVFGSATDGRRVLITEPDTTAIFFLRQILYLYKKVEYTSPRVNVVKTFTEFHKNDEALRPPTLRWNEELDSDEWERDFQRANLSLSDVSTSHTGDPLSTEDRLLFGVLDGVISRLSSLVSIFDPFSVVPKHGPGAVADLRTGGDKYSFPTYAYKMDNFLPSYWFTFYSEEIAWLYEDRRPTTFGESIGKVISVPKTFDSPRLITVEPTASQFLQQGLMRWFRDSLPWIIRRSINFLDQEPSRELALESSRTRKFATVDLSAASDRLSCWAVERIFRFYGGILPYLYATRTAKVLLPGGTDRIESLPEQLALKKFAGMGSAVTFPVQSIAYYFCCVAASLVHEYGLHVNSFFVSQRELTRISGNVRVFGDDLIVPDGAEFYLGWILELLQLKVNGGKSHSKGSFRESCGMDAFAGVEVTPLYLPSFGLGKSPESLASWIDVSNLAHAKGLFALMSWMDSKIPPRKRRDIPVSSAPMSCLTLATYSKGCVHKGYGRYDHDHQARMTRGLVLTPDGKTTTRESYDDLLDFFLKDPPLEETPLDSWRTHVRQGGYRSRSRLKMRREWVPVRY